MNNTTTKKDTNSSAAKDIQYFVLGEKDGDEAFQFMLDHFYTREPLNLATGGSLYKDRLYIKKDYVPSGVSVGARDPSTNALVGAVLSYTKTRGENTDYYKDTSIDHPGMRRFRKVMSHLHNAYDVFSNPAVDKMIHLGALATRPDFEGRGVGSTLLKKSEELGKSLGCQVANSDSLNPVTQRMLRKSGYDVVYSVDCKGFRIDGEEMFSEDSLSDDARVEVFVKYL